MSFVHLVTGHRGIEPSFPCLKWPILLSLLVTWNTHVDARTYRCTHVCACLCVCNAKITHSSCPWADYMSLLHDVTAFWTQIEPIVWNPLAKFEQPKCVVKESCKIFHFLLLNVSSSGASKTNITTIIVFPPLDIEICSAQLPWLKALG